MWSLPSSPKVMGMLRCSTTCRTEIAKALVQFYSEKTRGFPGLEATRGGQELVSANPVPFLRVYSMVKLPEGSKQHGIECSRNFCPQQVSSRFPARPYQSDTWHYF